MEKLSEFMLKTRTVENYENFHILVFVIFVKWIKK